MRILSDKYTAIAGAIGTMVGMMNKSGMCFRNRVIPANPNSVAQQGVRADLASLSLAWSETLSDAQRAAWEAWAATLTFMSSLGTPYRISGFNAFVAANGARMVSPLTMVVPGPTTAGLDSFTSVVPTFDDSSHTISVAYTNTDPWAREVGGGLIVRRCPLGFSAGITYYQGPFVYAGYAIGAVSPPTSPLVITLGAGAIVTGKQYAIAVRSVRADGRYSLERIFRGIAVA
ncbi:MAG: hypothetical protein ABFE01_05505 [Phycisphaerales bacterium]